MSISMPGRALTSILSIMRIRPLLVGLVDSSARWRKFELRCQIRCHISVHLTTILRLSLSMSSSSQVRSSFIPAPSASLTLQHFYLCFSSPRTHCDYFFWCIWVAGGKCSLHENNLELKQWRPVQHKISRPSYLIYWWKHCSYCWFCSDLAKSRPSCKL